MEEKTTKEKIIGTLQQIFDPEIPINIYDLGLIYGIEVNENGVAIIEMTLTSPSCPVAESLPIAVENNVTLRVKEVKATKINLVWEPSWNKDMITEQGRMELEVNLGI